jgi:hypothetical protein
MDQISLVDRRVEDGKRLVRQLVADSFDVTVAFWLKRSEEEWWYLYLASKIVDDKGPAEAFRALNNSLKKLRDSTVSLADIKLLQIESLLAKQMLQRRLNRVPLAYQSGSSSGGIEEGYIYPTDWPFEVIAKGKDAVLRHLEDESQATTGQAGEYVLARDEAGALWAVIAGHSFVGSGQMLLPGGKSLAFSNGIITDIRDR